MLPATGDETSVDLPKVDAVFDSAADADDAVDADADDAVDADKGQTDDADLNGRDSSGIAEDSSIAAGDQALIATDMGKAEGAIAMNSKAWPDLYETSETWSDVRSWLNHRLDWIERN